MTMTMMMMMDFKVLYHFFFLLAAAASPAAAKFYVVTLYYLNTNTESFLSLLSVINEKQREKREPTIRWKNFATLKFASTRPPPPILARVDETAFARKAVVVQIDF